jgi:hypothetical protein
MDIYINICILIHVFIDTHIYSGQQCLPERHQTQLLHVYMDIYINICILIHVFIDIYIYSGQQCLPERHQTQRLHIRKNQINYMTILSGRELYSHILTVPS